MDPEALAELSVIHPSIDPLFFLFVELFTNYVGLIRNKSWYNFSRREFWDCLSLETLSKLTQGLNYDEFAVDVS